METRHTEPLLNGGNKNGGNMPFYILILVAAFISFSIAGVMAIIETVQKINKRKRWIYTIQKREFKPKYLDREF